MEAGQRCHRHRHRPAAAICVSCAAPVCRSCLATTRVGVKCLRCAGGRPSRRWRTRIAAAGAAALLCIVAAATVTLLVLRAHNGGTPPATAPGVPAPTVRANQPVSTESPCSLDHAAMC